MSSSKILPPNNSKFQGVERVASSSELPKNVAFQESWSNGHDKFRKWGELYLEITFYSFQV